jgi:predicted Zn-dependent peptidase
MGDLNNISVDDAKAYFSTYYAPNNATIFVVGDFDPTTLKKWITAQFASIPAQEKPRHVVDSEPPQKGEKRISLHKEAQLPAVMIGYKSAPATSSDIHALNLLSTILSGGQSSRLYQRLVYDLQMVTEIESGVDQFIDPGLFYFYAQMQPGYETDEAEEELYAILGSIAREGVSEHELQKAKNAAQKSYIDEFKTNVGIANRMGYYEVIWGDYCNAFEVLRHLSSVTVNEIKDAAAKYLTESRRTVVTLVPTQVAAEVEEAQ